jgi:hypothetical protein
MSAAGWSALSVSLMKMQAAGVLLREEHEWVDQVIGWDFYDPVSDFHPVLGIHLPLAIRLGFRWEALDALFRGRPDDLEADERDVVTFIRSIISGTVDDASLRRAIARAGERGVVEQATAALVLCVGHVYARHALGLAARETHRSFPTSREAIRSLLDDLRSERVALPSIDEYERTFTRVRWPLSPPATDDAAAMELLRRHGLLDGFAPMVCAWQLVSGLSPMIALALEMWTVGGMKAQARGALGRRTRAWGGLALSLAAPEGAWALLGEFVPIALAAGIPADAITALARGHVDQLDPSDRATVAFARALVSRGVTPSSWAVQAAAAGADDRALCEQLMDVFLQWTRLRLAQLLRVEGSGDMETLRRLLARGTTVDLDDLEARYEAVDWKSLSSYTALAAAWKQDASAR